MTAVGAKKMVAKGKDETQVKTSGVFDYIGDLKVELKKVTWTSKDELKVYTKIVVVSTFFFGMGTFLSDVFIQNVLKGMSALVKMIGG